MRKSNRLFLDQRSRAWKKRRRKRERNERKKISGETDEKQVADIFQTGIIYHFAARIFFIRSFVNIYVRTYIHNDEQRVQSVDIHMQIEIVHPSARAAVRARTSHPYGKTLQV